MNRNLFAALRQEKVLMFIILVLIILVAAFNIVSTLIMMVDGKACRYRYPESDGGSESEYLAKSLCLKG